jgi:hypothetical protein
LLEEPLVQSMGRDLPFFTKNRIYFVAWELVVLPCSLEVPGREYSDVLREVQS